MNYKIFNELMSQEEALEILESEMKKHISEEVQFHIAMGVAIAAIKELQKRKEMAKRGAERILHIVRCGDCVFNETEDCPIEESRDETDFCSYGCKEDELDDA